MTREDVQRIFSAEDIITLNDGMVYVDDFLNVAGFKDAPDNPTKQDLHNIDKGIKGYADLIESGNYD